MLNTDQGARFPSSCFLTPGAGNASASCEASFLPHSQKTGLLRFSGSSRKIPYNIDSKYDSVTLLIWWTNCCATVGPKLLVATEEEYR
jgi:hypothetical protein